jgi:hypothetical protein
VQDIWIHYRNIVCPPHQEEEEVTSRVHT